MNTVLNVVPESPGNRYTGITIYETVVLLGNDLMRGDGVRVVSAWHHLPKIDPELLKQCGDPAAESLRSMVALDIGYDRANAGYDAFWVYAPFISLHLTYGEHWPLEVLARYLQLFKRPAETIAQKVWLRAVENYKAAKGYLPYDLVLPPGVTVEPSFLDA